MTSPHRVMGALVGIPAYLLLQPLAIHVYLALVAGLFAAGAWFCHMPLERLLLRSGNPRTAGPPSGNLDQRGVLANINKNCDMHRFHHFSDGVLA